MFRFQYIFVILILGLAVAFRLSSNKPQVLPKDQYLKVQAIVKVEPRLSEKSQTIEIGDSRVVVDIYPRYQVGDRILIEGQIESDGLFLYPKVQKVDHVSSFGSRLALLRNSISSQVNSLLPSKESTLLTGTVLGVDNISREFRDELIKTGTIHVVVVSGQNLMIVAGLFLSLTQYIGRRLSLSLATLAVLSYAILTGFEAPVVRASLMVLASTLAIYTGREYWPLLGLIVAALIIIFFAPQALFEISFQLTFAASLGIMTLGKKIQSSVPGFQLSDTSWSASQSISLATGQQKTEKLKSENRRQRTDNLKGLLIQNAAIATSAYIFTTPIILYYFGKVSILAPFANILVAEAIFPLMILGFLTAGASLILMPIAQIFAYLAYVPAFYFVKVVEIFASIPVEQVSFGQGNVWLVIVFYLILFLLMVIWSKRVKN